MGSQADIAKRQQHTMVCRAFVSTNRKGKLRENQWEHGKQKEASFGADAGIIIALLQFRYREAIPVPRKQLVVGCLS